MLIKIVGTYLALVGLFILLKPRGFGKIVNFFMKGRRIYLVGFLRLVLGFIFVVTAWQSRLPGLVYSLGVLIIISGTLLFALQKDTINEMADWLDSSPASFTRLWGVAAALFGSLIIYSA